MRGLLVRCRGFDRQGDDVEVAAKASGGMGGRSGYSAPNHLFHFPFHSKERGSLGAWGRLWHEPVYWRTGI